MLNGENDYSTNNENESDNLSFSEIDEEGKTEEIDDSIENTLLEAKYIANKIKNLIESKFQVYDLKLEQNRDIKYKDIAILLRSTKNKANIFEDEFMEQGIPVYSDTSSVYIDSIEIQTVLSVLKIIDNPLQDIPLVMVLRSFIGKFTDNDLVEVRLADEQSDFYTALLKAKISAKEELRVKIEKFLNQIDKWREQKEYLSLDELIWTIYEDTYFFEYVGELPRGDIRQANLKMLFERAREYEKASFKGLFNFIRFVEGLKAGNGDLSSAKIIGENEDVVRIMSIHKSKGLEFPVVFLASANTRFNLLDLNKDILLNQELGLGVKFIDYDMQIKYDTLTKLALRNKEFEATIAEEMRILYVALTRAKEKLYIVGSLKDYAKFKEKLENEIYIYKKCGNKINSILIKKHTNYIEWLLLVYNIAFEKIKNLTKLNIILKKDLIKDLNIKNLEEYEKQKNTIKSTLEELYKMDFSRVKHDFDYRYREETEIPSKTSITAISKKSKNEIIKQSFATQDEFVDIGIGEDESFEDKIELPVPKFLKNDEEEKITSARKGTIMHLCMKNLDVSKDYDLQDIKNMIKELTNKEIITKKEEEMINPLQILEFTYSDIWKDLKNAKKIYKEKEFYINVPANEVGEWKSTENILAQGIIDLYYINKDDELVLVDYKTDFVKKGEENVLITRHKEQLMLYKKALENAINKKVDKIYIYSFYLGAISLDL